MNKTRAGKNNPKKPKNPGKIEKIYYVVIALLIVILGGLVIFIFSNRDDAVTEGDQDTTPDSELITDSGEEDETEEEPADETPAEDEEADEETEESADETEDPDTHTDEDSETDADTADTEEDTEVEDEPEEEVDETDEAAEEDTTDEDEADDADINAEAPLDESYNINFGEGSSDRNAIAQNASAVSGISQSSMITWWVGNNGPGRAFTIVSDSGRNTVYRVELQYGEGSWHVTSAQELDGVPAEYR